MFHISHPGHPWNFRRCCCCSFYTDVCTETVDSEFSCNFVRLPPSKARIKSNLSWSVLSWQSFANTSLWISLSAQTNNHLIFYHRTGIADRIVSTCGACDDKVTQICFWSESRYELLYGQGRILYQVVEFLSMYSLDFPLTAIERMQESSCSSLAVSSMAAPMKSNNALRSSVEQHARSSKGELSPRRQRFW